MIVPAKPLWEGNKKACMYVCTNPMNVGRPQKLGFFAKKITAALKAQRNGRVNSLHASLICLGETVGAS